MDPQQGPPQPDLLIGQTIGNYLVTQKLGEGGMGSVYLAEHPTIGKKVALKVLHSEFSTNQDVADRFFREAKAVNDIGHPNIVDVVDFGIIQAGRGREQLVYFIMEYLAGFTLSQVIRNESPLPPERALGIALQVADALAASHKCGIVHRDLKPDNIILLQRGRERDFVKLLDFGIAKLTGGSAAGSHRTRAGIVMGTPAYMSPEQCEGRDSVDLRTDVYALGIVIYEMLTGRVPFVGEGYGEILVQHLTQRPVPPSQFRMLAAHVEVVVMKALEKRADMRYPTMEEFMRAMADPVGYVEAHGGVAGFLQRQLMPSSAPLPSVRLTPSPLTPLPGTLIAPSISTPPPTTPGLATGQLHGGRSKLGYVVAGLLVVAAAVAGIIALFGKDKVPVVTSVSDAGSDGGGSGAVVAGADPGSAAPDPGSNAGTGSAGSGDSGAAPAGSGTGPGNSTIPPAGSAAVAGNDGAGRATDGGGSSGVGPTIPPGSEPGPHGPGGNAASADEATSEITVISAPPGARILIDGVELGRVTPVTLTLHKKPNKKIAISLRLKGYNTYTFKGVDVAESSEQKIELVKLKTGGTIPASSGSGGRTNGSSNKPGSGAQGSGDPDGLMRPQ